MLFKLYSFTIFATCIVAVFTLCHDSNAVNQFPAHLVKNVGEFRTRMINGVIPRFDNFPFVVYVKIFERTGLGRRYRCTGSIIASKYVLTAFHCLVNPSKLYNLTLEEIRKDMRVYVGSMNKTDGRSYKVAAYDPFKTTKGNVDMVILKLYKEAKYKNGTAVSPVVLGRWTPKGGTVLTIAGHGRHIVNGHKQRVDSYVLANAKVAFNHSWEGNVGFYAWRVNEGPSEGDSGGPALKPTNGRFVQVGLTARSKVSEISGEPRVDGFYVLIAPYCDLIQEKTNGTARCRQVYNY